MERRSVPREAGSRHRHAAFFLAVLFLGTMAACTDILGITDRTLTSSGAGGGGTGGTTGGGGHAGTGGSGGTGGQETACASDADCAASPLGEKCDLGSGKCVECLPGPDDTCAFGLYCDVTRSCAIGCADDADCNPQGQGPLVCLVETHQCSECGATAACPPGTKCEQATQICVAGCTTDPECPTADWSCCGSQCKNVTKDLQNCGACDDPCEPSQSTTWLCLDGGCVFQSCIAGHADCNQNLGEGDGCEVELATDALHCGACGEKCSLANANSGCAGGDCTVAECLGGYENCNGLPADGCEADLPADPKNCGACGNKCSDVFANAVPTCSGSECKLDDCNAGFGDCDGNPANGCEVDTTTSLANCGGCGDVCTVLHGTAKCEASACLVDVCDQGFGDCTAVAGCETNTNTSATHCGECGTVCSFPHAVATCNGGGCLMGACAAGFGNCNGVEDDGCETDLTTLTNCGSCGNLCGNAGAMSATCQAGACNLICDANHKNCDSEFFNGCEIDITNSANNCGTCGNVCPSSAGSPANCVNKVCGSSSCGAGTADCNDDGTCETSLNQITNCGACGNVCSTNHTSSVACTGNPLECDPTCAATFGDCDGNSANGCEQSLKTNDHCTACGTKCEIANANVSCATGACTLVSCKPGFANCNGLVSDGCEVELATNTLNCGACGAVCSPANANGECQAGACKVQSCNSGFLNCNASPNDGCEVDKQTDIFNCGTCGNQCAFNNATPVCDAPGVCHIAACQGSFKNCDGNDANGCEANTLTSTQHCGTCGNQCASINGTASCNGSCNISCNSGFANCNGLSTDGCETSTHTLADCGGCNVPCNLNHATESCATGTCQILTCDATYNNCDGITATGCECGSTCSNLMCQGCGDGFCNSGGGESCLSCPSDCGGACPLMCGDGSCSVGETCMSCSADCGACAPSCGDGFCNGIETCVNCPIDCTMGCGPSCGDGFCDGTENCMLCPGDCGGPCAPFCGDGSCNGTDTCSTCSADCGPCATSGVGGAGGIAGAGGIIIDTTGPGVGGMGASGPGVGGAGASSSSSSGSGGAGGCSGGSGIQCNGSSCGGPGVGCCYPTVNSPFCGPPLMCTPVMGAFYACDDTSECLAGQVCCHMTGGGSACTAPASCLSPAVELCKTPSAGMPSCECTGSQQCCGGGGMKDPHYPTCQPTGMACK